MLTTSPITNQPVGKTFTVAIGALGVGAAMQLVLIGWAFWRRPPIAIIPLPPSRVAQVTGSTLGERSGLDMTNPLVEPAVTAEQAAALASAATPVPPRPTPVPVKSEKSEVVNRFDELMLQGKELRERGDTSAAIIRFREAATINQKDPSPLGELATTYEKMGLPDRAAEHYRKIIEMGPSAGPYLPLAEAKLQVSQLTAIKNAQEAAHAATTTAATTATPAPATTEPAPDTSTPVPGVAAGAILGLLDVTTEARADDNSAKHFVLHIPIKKRPKASIDVKDLVIHVLFYDLIDEQNVVQTSANVNSKWTTPPADWINSDVEELAVDYQLPKPAKHENRKYYGYIVRIYYKQQLQAATADPDRLAQQYPPPSTLPKENDK